MSRRQAPLPDRRARERIRTDLDASLLVEAGAGSGKTTALTDRMVALIASGRARAEEIAAITFTRKAAAELRQRFQNALEGELAGARAAGKEDAARRLDRALRDIDRSAVGTIHSFCARLLRERPIEAGLDPGFQELGPPAEMELEREFWRRHLDRLGREDDPLLRRLAAVGLDPDRLAPLFRRLGHHPDVTFPRTEVAPPDASAPRRELERLLDRAARLLPEEEPADGWDSFQAKLRGLLFRRHVLGWEEDAAFFDALATVAGFRSAPVQKRWSRDSAVRKRVKHLHADCLAFWGEGGRGHEALARWYAHRYPAALAFAGRAAREYTAHRVRTGRLGFQDLLAVAAGTLRENPAARRDLAARYRYLLIDEFQDTDPIQAEVAFLLAARDPETGDWTRTTPRPGALFVVGDPRQSIYRFRRADIAVYRHVRRRFRELERRLGPEAAGVVELTANFRSRKPIETFVNRVFADRFPAEASDRQASYAPMHVRPGAEREGGEAAAGGVYWYEIRPERNSMAAVAREDAARLASWIRRRVEDGEREPGDFLVLTYRKNFLHVYARALEARNVPVQVTGAELAIEEELRELRLLLRALRDPDDPTLTVAVLEGLFFGIDHEELAGHALGGGRLSFTRPIPEPATRVEEALTTLGRWWNLAREAPADVVVGEIVDALGLIPYAAAGELGATRAGALNYVIESVRRVGVEDDSSLHAAIEGLDAALASEEAEAPLEPGRGDVVRIMNLHKAKGTEAPVVVLAHPTGRPTIRPGLHVDRGEDGTARGYLTVRDPEARRPRGLRGTLARPEAWEELSGREARFRVAERDRLLYVAATRAAEELVVSRCPATEEKSFWAPFREELEARWPKLEMERVPPPDAERLEVSAAEVEKAVEAVAERRRRASAASYRAAAVTRRVEDPGPPPRSADGGRGAAWGTAVHRALEAAGRGAGKDELRNLCRHYLRGEQGEPVGPRDRPGEEGDAPGSAAFDPLLDDLMAHVETVLESAFFRRIREADLALHEVPFEYPLPGRESREIVRGEIDVAFREGDGWVVADYKTDVLADPADRRRRIERYRRQVDLYAECWEGLTGAPVVERLLYFTDTEEAFSWPAP